MQRFLRHYKVWLLIGFSFVALVIYLSLTPNPLDVPRVAGIKSGHFIAYAWCMFWFAQIYRGVGQRIAIALALCALGIGLEYVQGWVGRDFAYSDMRDDAIGVAAGLILAATQLANILAYVDDKLKR